MRYWSPGVSAFAFIQLVTFQPKSRAGPWAATPMELPKVPSQARPRECSEGWPGRGEKHDQAAVGNCRRTWDRMCAVRWVILPVVVGSSTIPVGLTPLYVVAAPSGPHSGRKGTRLNYTQ